MHALGWMPACLLAVAMPAHGELERVSFQVVYDTETDLHWAVSPANSLNWHQSLSYCAGLELGEFVGWSMPTLSELQTLSGQNLSLLGSNDLYLWTADDFYAYGEHRATTLRMSPYSQGENATSTVHHMLGVRCLYSGSPPSNSPPNAPAISGAPGSVELGETITVNVVSGSDPEGDPVKLRCSAQHSDHDDDQPWMTSLAAHPVNLSASFTFHFGEIANIRCTTTDELGLTSPEAVVSFPLTEAPPPPLFLSIADISVQENAGFEHSFTLTGGVAPYTATVTGTFPGGDKPFPIPDLRLLRCDGFTCLTPSLNDISQYTFTLEVVDAEGRTAADDFVVTVSDTPRPGAPPAPGILSPIVNSAAGTVLLRWSAVTSGDPNWYQVTWTDGNQYWTKRPENYLDTQVLLDSADGLVHGVEYSGYVRAHNTFGYSEPSASVPFHLQANRLPTATCVACPSSGTTGEQVEFRVQVTDPDGDDVLVNVDWGDGATEDLGLVPEGSIVVISHRYQTDGYFPISFTLRDHEAGLPAVLFWSWTGTSLSEDLPVAYYPFDGNAQDASGLGHHGTVNGAVLTEDAFGNPDSAYRFDGEDDHILTPNSVLLDDLHRDSYSISAIWKPDELPEPGAPGYALVVKQGWNIGLMTDQRAAAASHVIAGNQWATVLSDQVIELGRFHHLVATVDRAAGSTRIYVNGALAGETSWTPGAEVGDVQAQPWVIGRASPDDAFPYNWPAKGVIDEVALYAKALTGDEVAALHAGSGLAPPTPSDDDGWLLGDPDGNGVATPSVGFGVNPANGNFFHAEVDASMPGKDIPFLFARYFNSLDDGGDGFGRPRPQPMGPSWSHSYNLQLHFDAAGDRAHLIWADGRRDAFRRNGATWTADSPSNFAELASDGEAGWVVATRDHLRYHFGRWGRLWSIRRAHAGGEHRVTIDRDDLARVQQVTDTAGRVVLFHYGTHGRLKRLDLPGGDGGTKTILFGYTADGRLSSVTDRNGQTRRYEYSASHMGLFPATAAAQPVLKVSFDADGRVEKQETATQLIGGLGAYVFSWSDGRLDYSTPSGDGNAVFRLDAIGRVVNVSEGGDIRTLSYAAEQGPEAVLPSAFTDLVGRSFSAAYANGDLKSLGLPDNTAIDIDYDDHHQPVRIDTPEGGELRMSPNARGRLERIISGGVGVEQASQIDFTYGDGDLVTDIDSQTAAGTQAEIGYTVNGQPNLIRLNTGDTWLETQVTYDAIGRRISEQDPRGTLTCWFYDAENQVADIVQGLTDGCRLAAASTAIRRVHLEYDADGRLLSRTRGYGGPLTRETSYSYNPSTGQVSEVCESGNGNGQSRTRCVALRYDRDGVLERTIDDAGRVTRFYRMAGGRIEVVRSNANTGASGYQSPEAISRSQRNANDELLGLSSCTAVESPASALTIQDCAAAGRVQRIAISRDDLGRPTSITYPLAADGSETRRYRYSYSEQGRVTTRTDDQGGYEIAERNGRGELIRVTQGVVNGDAVTARYHYDGEGRLLRIIDPSGFETQYSYDRAGRTLSRSDLSGTLGWTYDDLNGTVTETRADRTWVRTSRDRLGRISRIQASDGLDFGFSYDALGQLVRETWAGPAGSGERSFAYTALGELAQVTEPLLGATLTYSYDGLGRLSSLAYGGSTTVYSYDGLDRISAMTTPAGVFGFGWQDHTDALGRVSFPNGVVTTYNRNNLGELVGMRTAKTNDPLIARYDLSLDAAGRRTDIDVEQPVAPGFLPEDLSFSFDAKGLLAGLNGTPVTHDARGNLTGLPAPFGQQLGYDGLDRLLSVDGTGNRYDARRNRVQRDPGEAGEQRYLLDLNAALPDLLAVYDAHNAPTTRYVHGPGGLLAQVRPGEVRYVHQDFNANVIALTDGDAQVTDAFAYTPYGRLAGRSGDTKIPFQFAGGVGAMTDPGGSIYMRARHYHPGIRQFTSADLVPGDPMRPQSLARYAYVEGMALGGVDPSGLSVDPSGLRFWDHVGMLGSAFVDAVSDWGQRAKKHVVDTPADKLSNNMINRDIYNATTTDGFGKRFLVNLTFGANQTLGQYEALSAWYDPSNAAKATSEKAIDDFSLDERFGLDSERVNQSIDRVFLMAEITDIATTGYRSVDTGAEGLSIQTQAEKTINGILSSGKIRTRGQFSGLMTSARRNFGKGIKLRLESLELARETWGSSVQLLFGIRSMIENARTHSFPCALPCQLR